MSASIVSIITPCYNTGSIVHRLLDSVLMQDYPNIEMFCINDGSTDNTEEVINSYIPKFEEKGYKLTYIYQKNGGQSSAINNGLKYVNGEYLIWPDSDDFFKTHNAISIFVKTLQENGDEYGVVRCIPTWIDEDTLEESRHMQYISEYDDINQFENCLFTKNFFWGAGDYMVKMSIFDKAIPNREIYVEKNAGQNWQMLLPILYTTKCYTIKESLFCVLERAASHSRKQYTTYEQQIVKFTSYKNTILQTLSHIEAMSNEEKVKWSSMIENKYLLLELELSVKHNRKDKVEQLIMLLANNGIYPSSSQLLRWRAEFSIIGRMFIRMISAIRKCFK